MSFFLLHRPPPVPTLFPYTTLFRSDRAPRFIFAPIQIDLQWMHAGSGIANEPFITAGLLIDGLRFDFEPGVLRSEEHTSELQSRFDLVCRLPLEKNN